MGGTKPMEEKTYHCVLTFGDATELLTSDLFINNREGAEKMFKDKIKELNPRVEEGTLEFALDEGYYTWNNCTAIYTEPFNVFGKE
jgi:hypothetical protein